MFYLCSLKDETFMLSLFFLTFAINQFQICLSSEIIIIFSLQRIYLKRYIKVIHYCQISDWTIKSKSVKWYVSFSHTSYSIFLYDFEFHTKMSLRLFKDILVQLIQKYHRSRTSICYIVYLNYSKKYLRSSGLSASNQILKQYILCLCFQQINRFDP